MVVPHIDSTSHDEVPLRDFDTHGLGVLPADVRSTRSQCMLLLGTACHGATREGDADLVPEEMGSAWPVVKAIKKALDPNNIMNPGKQSLDEAYE
jgi:hypothetical protein